MSTYYMVDFKSLGDLFQLKMRWYVFSEYFWH